MLFLSIEYFSEADVLAVGTRVYEALQLCCEIV